MDQKSIGYSDSVKQEGDGATPSGRVERRRNGAELGSPSNNDATTLRRIPGAPRREESDDYIGVVARISDSARVIECRYGIQWILQVRRGTRGGQPTWRSVSFCRTRSGLEQAIERRFCPELVSAVAHLPGRFDDNRNPVEQVFTRGTAHSAVQSEQKQRCSLNPAEPGGP